MSADEIKALAQQAFVDGMASHRAGLNDMEVRCKQYANALLDYAAAVERCEEVISDVNGPNSRFDHGIATPDFDANEIVDYILKGATNGTKH